MKLVRFSILISICLWGCNNESHNRKNLTSRMVLDFKDKHNSYSLSFTTINSLTLTTSDKIQKTVPFDKSDSKTLDSFMNVLKQKKSDTLHFLPHLEAEGSYSIILPFDTSLNATLTYGENKPKILYDLVTWAEELKARSFSTSK